METLESQDKEAVDGNVRGKYAAIAHEGGSCCGAGGCGTSAEEKVTLDIGYSKQQLNAVPEGANLGLGCGAPIDHLALQPGETVVDLGSGAGIDVFLAADVVGPTGKVIGVDMTPEMVSKARANAAKGGYPNVEFRLGEIEHLPVADASVDVIISNCVINLAPDKTRVFAEMYRVLRPGGRVGVSDVVTDDGLTDDDRAARGTFTGCIAGALPVSTYRTGLQDAGFTDVDITRTDTVADGVHTAIIRAARPTTTDEECCS